MEPTLHQTLTLITQAILAIATLLVGLGTVTTLMLRRTIRKATQLQVAVDQVHALANSRLQTIEDKLFRTEQQLATAVALIATLQQERDPPHAA